MGKENTTRIEREAEKKKREQVAGLLVSPKPAERF